MFLETVRPRPSPCTDPSLLSTQDSEPDGMTLYPTPSKLMIYSSAASVRKNAADLMKSTPLALKEGVQLKLYKISSNLKSVPIKFLADDLAKDLKDFEIRKGDKPIQKSLGISWDINPDVFIFKISSDQKPFTQREVLSTINSLFEPPPPLGFASPVTGQGKILFWLMLQSSSGIDWDNPFDDFIRF